MHAGFRACLRCHPANPEHETAGISLVRRICHLLETTADEDLSLADLSAELKLSPAHLQRTFKQIFGVSPREFARARKFAKFKAEAKTSDVTTALYAAGFNSSRALYENAADRLGMTPAQYRNGGKDAAIRYALADCTLGKCLVARTAKGVCAVSFGDSAEQLINDLRAEYPAAEISAEDEFLQDSVREILQMLAGERTLFSLPLDLRATAFQLRVWAELRQIPHGATASYKQIAEQLGDAKKVRAVARACATNPVALITPCHRVVAADGKLSGYRWGVARKAQLLAHEAEFSKG